MDNPADMRIPQVTARVRDTRRSPAGIAIALGLAALLLIPWWVGAFRLGGLLWRWFAGL